MFKPRTLLHTNAAAASSSAHIHTTRLPFYRRRSRFNAKDPDPNLGTKKLRAAPGDRSNRTEVLLRANATKWATEWFRLFLLVLLCSASPLITSFINFLFGSFSLSPLVSPCVSLLSLPFFGCAPSKQTSVKRCDGGRVVLSFRLSLSCDGY